jgi:hypothetical protein
VTVTVAVSASFAWVELPPLDEVVGVEIESNVSGAAAALSVIVASTVSVTVASVMVFVCIWVMVTAAFEPLLPSTLTIE